MMSDLVVSKGPQETPRQCQEKSKSLCIASNPQWSYTYHLQS